VLNIVPGADEAAAADDADVEDEVLLSGELDADVLEELLHAAPSSTMPASATTTVHRRGTRCWNSDTRYLLQSFDRYVGLVRTSATDGLRWIYSEIELLSDEMMFSAVVDESSSSGYRCRRSVGAHESRRNRAARGCGSLGRLHRHPVGATLVV
jgi:hypothetical protein